MQKIKVVIVEDTMHIAERMAKFFENKGFEVVPVDKQGTIKWAESYQEAIQLIETSAPSVVVLDYEIVGGNGLEILNHFAKNKMLNFFFFIITDHRDAVAAKVFDITGDRYFLGAYNKNPLEKNLEDMLSKLDFFRTFVEETIDDFFLASKIETVQKEKWIIKQQNECYLFKLSEVVYLESSGEKGQPYTRIYLSDEKTFYDGKNKPSKISSVMVSGNLGTYEKKLEGKGFQRINSSTIVNLNYVLQFGNRNNMTLALEGVNQRFEMEKSYADELKKNFIV